MSCVLCSRREDVPAGLGFRVVNVGIDSLMPRSQAQRVTQVASVKEIPIHPGKSDSKRGLPHTVNNADCI